MATTTLSGGEKLEKALDKIAQALGRGGVVSVGFLSDARYPNGLYVASVAAWNDFGTRNMPARPFFRNMIAAESPGWGKALTVQLKDTGYDAPKALGRMGDRIKGQLQESILDTFEPPLAKSTIARKGSSKPLIDTSFMIKHAGYRVET